VGLEVGHGVPQLEQLAYRDVSFEVGRGEVFGFLGPNGAGKTTTVRTLGTLIAPTSDTATVAGLELTPEHGVAIRQRIAIMPEAPGLYLRLSVRDNLLCFADLYELPDPLDRIRLVLDAVGLGDRVGDPCGALSKGLRQRVSLARALLGDPEQTLGRPDELRDRLFRRTLTVRTASPLADPSAVFGPVSGVTRWHSEGPGSYVLDVADVAVAAPATTRALVAAGADVLALVESRHSLEDVYLQFVEGRDGEQGR